MIIKNIKLENFGPHSSIDFDTGGEKVVGLLGSNGSGKTTILSAIKYAITGDIEDTIESNVKKGATSGKVEITFIKSGKEGKIVRTLGKTSKAKLVWEDSSYTAKKEIEKVLQRIVGGDKQALANAVFMGQGSLNKLLFGSDTEREQLFVKLHNLSYLQKYSDALDQKRKTLDEDLGNIIPMMDSLNEQRIELATRQASYENTLKDMSDLSEIIGLMNEEKEIKKLVNSLNLNKVKITEKMHAATSNISSILGDLTKADLDRETKEVKEDIDAVNASKAEYEGWKVRYEAYAKLNADYKKSCDDLAAAESAIEAAGLSSDWAEHEKNINSVTDKLVQLDFEISQLKAWQKAQFESFKHDEACDKCGLAKIQTGHESFSIGIDPSNNLSDLIKKKEVDHSKIAEELKTLADIMLMGDNFVKLQEKRNNLAAELQDKYPEGVDSPKGVDQDLAKSLTSLSTKLSKLESTKNKMITERGSLNALGDTFGELSMQIENSEKSLNSEKFKVLENYSEELSVYENKQVLYNEVKAKLNETTTLLADVTKKYSVLLDKEESTRKKKELCDELKQLKDVFSKKGIPKEYINSKFNIITELTQKNLDILGTDFFIEPAAEKSLSFNFTRFIDGEQMTLPMNKLSGGQRVRLSLSFILSIQQLIMAEIGFITLDEPSTHLDEEGIDSLGDLLRKIREIFADSEHQLWVCDHNPKLEASFDKTLVLQS